MGNHIEVKMRRAQQQLMLPLVLRFPLPFNGARRPAKSRRVEVPRSTSAALWSHVESSDGFGRKCTGGPRCVWGLYVITRFSRDWGRLAVVRPLFIGGVDVQCLDPSVSRVTLARAIVHETVSLLFL